MQKNCQSSLDDFVIFILSHNNPYNNYTLKSLNKFGYTYKWYLVLDDADPQLKKYYEVYDKENILVFNKDKIEQQFDIMDTWDDRNCVVYARNACFYFAEQLGYTYFMELDDDYYEFNFRFEEDNKLVALYPTNLDDAFEALLEYYINNPQITSLALGQDGDFLGGAQGGNYKKKVLRKAMNTFICSTKRKFIFNGRMNEDVNTYALEGSRGKLFITVLDMSINQKDTQTKGMDIGMNDIYTTNGTYLKSFYTVMCCPSFTKISIMGNNHARIHHNIRWDNAVPKIISSKYKKGN